MNLKNFNIKKINYTVIIDISKPNIEKKIFIGLKKDKFITKIVKSGSFNSFNKSNLCLK